MQAPARTPVTTSVTQPPSPNFTTEVTARMSAVTRVPSPASTMRRRQCASVRRTCHQWRTMPSCESVNVMNTLIEYMTISTLTEPRV